MHIANNCDSSKFNDSTHRFIFLCNLTNFTPAIIIQTAEKQDSEEDNELIINIFIKTAPRAILVLFESRQVHGELKR